MSDERFKAWLTFWQFVLGTVVLGLFSTVISHQIQTREVEIKEQEANAKFLEQALQEDVGVRRRLAQYFAHVTRSAELRERWAEYATLVDKEYQDTLKEKENLQKAVKAEGLDAAEKDRLTFRIVELERQLSPKPASVDAVPARLYIHIGRAEQRAGAQSAADALGAEAVVVPGIELRSNTPQASELRYFRMTERSEAEGMAATVRTVWPDVKARYVAGFEQSTGIRPRHYELWLSKQAKPQ
jgi:hypothetical protein